MPDRYDLIVIGGGPGGLEAAQRVALAGKRVLIIERSGWGGTCTHKGCIPTKALLTCSEHYADLKKARRLGITVASASFDFSAMKKHQQQIVKIAALGAQKMLEEAKVEKKAGTGSIVSPGEVQFTASAGDSEIIFTDNIIVACGSEPRVLPGINLSSRILTSDGILNLNELPHSLAIVGGSFIGVELATFFAELGVKVTLIELLERILPLEDEEAADFLKQELNRLGIAVHNSTRLTGLQEMDDGIVIRAQKESGPLEVKADYVLLCTGRRPLLNEPELINASIAYDRNGIKIDEKMRTGVSGIYAVGDVTGGMMLAHRAGLQAKVAAAAICGYDPPPYNENHIPSVVYSHPQIARVGYTEKAAVSEGRQVRVIRSDYSANVMARAELAGSGFVKAVFEGDQMIGATIAGEQAAELIAPLVLAVSSGLTEKQLHSWVIAHPTLSEIFIPFM